jgi:hypothetical protein
LDFELAAAAFDFEAVFVTEGEKALFQGRFSSEIPDRPFGVNRSAST